MENAPIILAIDTSLGPCSVTLLSDGIVAAELREEKSGQQSRILVPMIEAALAEANVDYADCTAIACSIGPGGFTGIRVGLSTARAIALAATKPLIGLSTLEIIAYGAHGKGDILAIIDAYRGQWYVQRFRMNGTLSALSEALLVDEKGIQALAHGAKIVQTLPNATDLALLAQDKWMRGERRFSTTPLYIREPDAKLPTNEGLKYSDELL